MHIQYNVDVYRSHGKTMTGDTVYIESQKEVYFVIENVLLSPSSHIVDKPVLQLSSILCIYLCVYTNTYKLYL